MGPRDSREFPTILTQPSSGPRTIKYTFSRVPVIGNLTLGRTLLWQKLTLDPCPTGREFQTALTPPCATATTTPTSSKTGSTTGSTRTRSLWTRTGRHIRDRRLLGGLAASPPRISKRRGRRRKMSGLFWIETPVLHAAASSQKYISPKPK